jgi:hypothetical protein
VRALVGRTDTFPFRPLYSGVYRAGVALLKQQLRSLPGLRGLYLSGSYARQEHIHGISDIDFFVVLHHGSAAQLPELTRRLQRCSTLFPFLGPVSERSQQVVIVDAAGEIDNPDFLYRWKAGELTPLLVQPGFEPRTSMPWSLQQLNQINLQLKTALGAVRAGKDTPLSWRSRLRVLQRMLGADKPPPPPPVGRLLSSPRSYVGNRDESLQDTCFDYLLQLSEACARQATAHSKLQRVAMMDTSYKLPNLPAQAPVLGGPLTRARLRGMGPGAFELQLENFRLGFADTRRREVQQVGAMFSWLPLALVGFAEPVLSVSRWEMPWVFGDQEIDGELWAYLQVQAAATRAAIASQLAQGEKSLLESDWGLIQALLAAHTLTRFQQGQLVTQREHCLAELVQAQPQLQPLASELEAYAGALECGTGWEQGGQLASNFYGYLVESALAVLEGAACPPAERLQRRLSLSLCVVTRDRPQWLAALLHTVAAQRRLPDELVIVDNSPVGSAAPVADSFSDRLPVRYVAQIEGRLGALRNRAVQESCGEIVCFTDDDCLLDPGWLGHVERSFLRDARIGAVGGRVRHYSESGGAVDRFHQIYLG